MRLIDADELRAFLVKAGRLLKAQDDKRTAAHAVGKIIEYIDNMPTVDAEPVRHGHWEYVDVHLLQVCYRCSECGHVTSDYTINKQTLLQDKLYYCPNCGAKMDEGGKTMKIIIDTNDSVPFASLNAGDVFTFDNGTYMKCSAFSGEFANAVCLGLGKICMFGVNKKVYPIEAELHVKL